MQQATGWVTSEVSVGKKEETKMKTTRKSLLFPDALLEEVEKFMKDNYITTFTVAIIELVRRGLESTKGGK